MLGTLYNRFVLNLRGLDQLPQFTLEGMKYHLHEALDWIKDVASKMAESRMEGGFSTRPGSGPGGFGSGESGFGSGESGLSFSRGGVGASPKRNIATNPISHQSQVSAAASEGGGGFMRPQLPRGGSGVERRADINPVSHQSQVQVTSPPPTQDSTSTSPPRGGISLGQPPQQDKTQSLPPKKEKPRPPPFNLESTEQEREFMLGDDDEDDEASGVSKSTRAGNGAGSSEDNSAAAMRGRDLEDGGVIRL